MYLKTNSKFVRLQTSLLAQRIILWDKIGMFQENDLYPKEPDNFASQLGNVCLILKAIKTRDQI